MLAVRARRRALQRRELSFSQSALAGENRWPLAAVLRALRPHADSLRSAIAVAGLVWEMALDMNAKYKETAEGGLALQIPVNVVEC